MSSSTANSNLRYELGDTTLIEDKTQVERYDPQLARSSVQNSAQPFQNTIQTPGLRVKQGKCTFGKITITGKAQMDSGNFIVSNTRSGTFEQDGSAYEEIEAGVESKTRLGNYINGDNGDDDDGDRDGDSGDQKDSRSQEATR